MVHQKFLENNMKERSNTLVKCFTESERADQEEAQQIKKLTKTLPLASFDIGSFCNTSSDVLSVPFDSELKFYGSEENAVSIGVAANCRTRNFGFKATMLTTEIAKFRLHLLHVLSAQESVIKHMEAFVEAATCNKQMLRFYDNHAETFMAPEATDKYESLTEKKVVKAWRCLFAYQRAFSILPEIVRQFRKHLDFQRNRVQEVKTSRCLLAVCAQIHKKNVYCKKLYSKRWSLLKGVCECESTVTEEKFTNADDSELGNGQIMDKDENRINDSQNQRIRDFENQQLQMIATMQDDDTFCKMKSNESIQRTSDDLSSLEKNPPGCSKNLKSFIVTETGESCSRPCENVGKYQHRGDSLKKKRSASDVAKQKSLSSDLSPCELDVNNEQDIKQSQLLEPRLDFDAKGSTVSVQSKHKKSVSKISKVNLTSLACEKLTSPSKKNMYQMELNHTKFSSRRRRSRSKQEMDK